VWGLALGPASQLVRGSALGPASQLVRGSALGPASVMVFLARLASGSVVPMERVQSQHCCSACWQESDLSRVVDQSLCLKTLRGLVCRIRPHLLLRFPRKRRQRSALVWLAGADV